MKQMRRLTASGALLMNDARLETVARSTGGAQSTDGARSTGGARPTARRGWRRLAATAGLAAVLTASVVGCAPEASLPTDSPAPGQSGDPVTPTETPGEPAPSQPAGPVGEPIDIACDELIDNQSMYDFDPNFALVDEPELREGSTASRIADERGTVCQWTHLTSGVTITAAVASMPDDALTRVANETYESSNMVPTYGVEGYFEVQESIGEAVVFDAPYWVAMSSVVFAEPGDASDLMAVALDALP